MWAPLPGPQTQALDSAADVTGYGGAAGGGKTDLQLGLALTRHRRSIIFRREGVQLRGVLDRARDILGATGRLNENTGVWRGLPGGRQIEFAGCKDIGDEQKHRGRPHDLICFDEADQFLEFQVRFLQGWLRTTIPGQRCRVVLAFNPPATAEGRWLLTYFAPWLDPAHPHRALPGELRWFATLPDGAEVERPDGVPFAHAGEQIQPKSRTFIPAKVQDNPFLLATGYVSTLQALPEPLRSQLLHGDFLAGMTDDPWQVIPTAWVKAAQARWTPTGAPGPQTTVGADVARGGDDQTVLSRRHGPWFAPLLVYPGTSTPDGPAVATLVLAAREGAAAIHVDVIGVGGSVYDHLRSAGGLVWGVNVAEADHGTDKSGRLGFRNLRAGMYWRFREALDPVTGDTLALPPDAALLADLTAPRWSLSAQGIQVEGKEDLRKRLKRSTDRSDAVLLAFLTTPVVTHGPDPWAAAAPDTLPDVTAQWRRRGT